MPSSHKFRDRAEAGQRLAAHLAAFANKLDVLVLALPRGGVPVGAEVARALGCPLDVLIVRKLGTPGQDELAMGAITTSGVCEWNHDVIDTLGITPEERESVRRRETLELERREKLYRRGRPFPDLRDRQVVLVDDGLATGTTMHAAVSSVNQLGARRVVVAVPVGSMQACNQLRPEVDSLVCMVRPADLVAVGYWYDDFKQVTDEEVRDLLQEVLSRAGR